MVHRLKNMSIDKKITLVYGGLKLVPSLNTIYWDTSLVMQAGKLEAHNKVILG